jgi:hypothetical protein
MLFALLASTCFAQTPSPQYGVKDSAAPTGSNIKRYVTQGSEIPINRTYAELSPEEKASVNRYYENIEPGDEPPFPLEGLAPIYKAFAKLQSRLAAKGNLVLVATVDADGSVAEVKAIGSPSPEITMAAANIIIVSKFKPAICKGQPCKMDFPFSFAFALQ